jgi:hypothetical protein
LIGQPARSFEEFFGQMLKDVAVRDEKSLSRLDLFALKSMRLLCALWPSKVNITKYAQLCLEVDVQVEEAYHLLLVFIFTTFTSNII